jgi:Na+-driven multidrug efflux pump
MLGTKDLTCGPIRRQLFKLAMPILATSFTQMAYSMTDMAWVGRINSKAVAAVGAVGILTWMAGSISLLNKVGSEVSVAQSIGADDAVAARNFASHNITIALLISLVLGGVLFLFAYPIIGFFCIKTRYYLSCCLFSTHYIYRLSFYFSFGCLYRYLQRSRTK